MVCLTEGIYHVHAHVVHFLYQTKAISKRYLLIFIFFKFFCDDLLFIHFTYLLIYLRDSYIIKATTNRSLGSGLIYILFRRHMQSLLVTDSKHLFCHDTDN